MKRPEMVSLIKQVEENVGILIDGLRHEKTKRCRLCDADVGVQHVVSCPAWPLIEMRHRLDPDAVEPPSGMLP